MAPRKSKKIATAATHARPQLTDEQKAARKQKNENLSFALKDSVKNYLGQARSIAKEYGRMVSWTKSQLFMGGRFLGKHRQPSAYNAFIQARLAAANNDLPPGKKWRLRDFTKHYCESLKRDYAKLSSREKTSLTEGLKIVRTTRVKMVRANPKAIAKYADTTFADMEKDWTAIMSRTSMQGMYFAVRSGTDEYHEPKMFLTSGAESFICEVLGMEPRTLVLKLEAWSVSKLADQPLVKKLPTLAKAISLCRQLIQEGLERVVTSSGSSGKKKITMNYDNYEAKIVETYAVDLVGWPCGKMANPGTIGRDNVYALLNALEGPDNTRTCYWVKLTADELEGRKARNAERAKNGEIVYKPRKKVQRKEKPKKSAEVVDSSEEEDNGDSGQGSQREGSGELSDD